MADRLRVILEIGRKRRVVAGAMDWPGLDRWGTSEDDALAKLSSYLPRYANVADRAGMGPAFARSRDVEVVERVPGSSSTDFWGIAHVASSLERQPLGGEDLERRLTLLQACWAYFDDAFASAPAELRHGPRGGGWTRDQLEGHVYVSEAGQMTRKVDVRTPRDMLFDPAGRAMHRQQTLAAIRAYHADGRQARSWPIPFLIRRMAQHLLDHTWELQDRSILPTDALEAR